MAETASNRNLRLTSGRLLARNTLWNLFGNVAPMIVAVFSIPILIRDLGKDRFGVMTLAWALIGYASLFDIGLGRALTQVIAKKLGAGEDHEVPKIAWTSLLLMLVLGVIGACLVAVISPWLVHRMLKIPDALRRETLQSFYLLAISIPVVIIAAGLRGLLEAHQRFDLVTYLRIPLGIFTFASPLLVLPFSQNLVPVVGVLVIGRFLGCVAHYWLCLRVAPEIHRGIVWDTASVGPLLRFGGWMTVSNLVGPLMISMDRFVIASLISVTAVAYYVTPFEVLTKLWIVSTAIAGVMFPAFSLSGDLDRERAAMLYRRTMKYTLAIFLPATAALVISAKWYLTLWLGAAFASHSFRVAQLLLAGIFAMAMANLPFALVQGLGRPDIPAKLNLLEIPFYALGLFWLVENYGVAGAAFAWMLRAAIDSLLLTYLAHCLQRERLPTSLRLSKEPVLQ